MPPIQLLTTLYRRSISPKEILILHHIASKGPAQPGHLRETLGNNCSSTLVTVSLDTLEKKGLIRREPNPEDRRSVLAHNTPAATALLKDLHITHTQAPLGNEE